MIIPSTNTYDLARLYYSIAFLPGPGVSSSSVINFSSMSAATSSWPTVLSLRDLTRDSQVGLRLRFCSQMVIILLRHSSSLPLMPSSSVFSMPNSSPIHHHLSLAGNTALRTTLKSLFERIAVPIGVQKDGVAVKV